MVLQIARTILRATLRPKAFFRDDDAAFEAAPALLLGFGHAVFVGLFVVAMGVVITLTVDVAITVENPDLPSDRVCDQHGSDPESLWYDACQRPETVERDVGTILHESIRGTSLIAAVGALIAWFVYAGIVHVAAKAAGGRGSFAHSLSISSWGLLPVVAHMLVALLLWGVLLETTAFSGPMETFLAQFEATVDRFRRMLLPVGAIAVLWQWYVWTFGLRHGHDLSLRSAATAGGSVAILAFLLYLYGTVP